MSSLSDSDAMALQRIGRDTIKSIIALCVESVLWTIYLVLIVTVARILLRKGYRTKRGILILILVFTMFLMDSAMYTIDINNAIKEITYTLTSNSSSSLTEKYALTNNMNKLPWPVENAIYSFMANLGDIVIIWRVYAFYPDRKDRWVLALLSALLFGSIITSCLLSFCVAEFAKNPFIGDFINPPFCRHVQLSMYCTTLATTGVATFLMCYKTWHYRRTIGRHLRCSPVKTRGERIMVILVESGILYFLFFLELVISDSGDVAQLEASTAALAIASDVWTYMTSHILGIYPVVVVILVHSQRSYIDTATVAVHSMHDPSSYTSSDMRQQWVHPRAVSAQLTHPIEISVSQLREMHTDASDDGVDEPVILPRKTKFDEVVP